MEKGDLLLQEISLCMSSDIAGTVLWQIIFQMCRTG